MAREYLPKLTIALLALSIAFVLLSAQPTQVSALSGPQSYYPRYYHHYGYGYWWGNWWSYPYYYYYYPSYYYSSYCPSNYNYNYYGYPYYYYYSGYYYCSPTSYTLTVSTDPTSLGTVTGGGSYTSGSSASFSVTQSTVQVSSNTRYVFDHWSGDYSGVGTNGKVTMNGAMTVTAEYQLQYYLSVNAQPQNAPAPSGAGWYNSGASATVQNGGQTIGDSTSRLVFQGWSIDGQASQSGATLSVVMDGPHSVTAVYGQQYYLNVQTDQGVASGSGWYNAGSTAQIYVSTPISTSYGVSIVFNGWQGDIQSSSQSTTVLMDGPKNVIATWRTDPTVLYLTIAAIIIAAVLIVAGVIVFVARGRSGTQAPPTQAPPAPPTTPRNEVQQSEPATAHKTEHHRRKTTTEKLTAENEPTENTTAENTPSNEPAA
jgi:hypothetical protein